MSSDDETPPAPSGCDDVFLAADGDLARDDQEGAAAAAFAELSDEVARLRRTLLKQGHAQERLHARLEQEIRRLASRRDPSAPPAEDEAAEAGAARRAGAAPEGAEGAAPELTMAQQRVLMDLDQAVQRLLDLARQAGSPPAAQEEGDGPQTLREGLVLLQVRVHNLQRSFGLEPIPSRGRPFDDRCHKARGVCDRPDLPDGVVAEELLPGYRLLGEVVRPAVVIVNRRGGQRAG